VFVAHILFIYSRLLDNTCCFLSIWDNYCSTIRSVIRMALQSVTTRQLEKHILFYYSKKRCSMGINTYFIVIYRYSLAPIILLVMENTEILLSFNTIHFLLFCALFLSRSLHGRPNMSLRLADPPAKAGITTLDWPSRKMDRHLDRK
jgi:hypothetical protein